MVVFHQDKTAFLPRVLSRGDNWPALPAYSDTPYTEQALTETASPNPAVSAALGSSKRNSNCAQQTDFQTASPSPPVNQDSDVTLVASIEYIDGDSDSVKSAKNSPTSPANTSDLVGHISELEEIHEVAEGELIELARQLVLFSCIDEFKIPELDNAETNPLENHQDNGATPSVNTQPYPPHSPLKEAPVDSSAPLSRPCVEAGNAALQVQEGNILDVRPPWHRMHSIWRLPGLGTLKSRRTLGWSNSRRQ